MTPILVILTLEAGLPIQAGNEGQKLGGKCEFAATAQRLSQFAKTDIHATEIYIPDVASPHDRSEPFVTDVARRKKVR